MPFRSPVQITQLLNAWSEGDQAASNSLFSAAYEELHDLAQWHMSAEADGHLLQPSALINEAFLRLTAGVQPRWSSRAQFFGYCARIMRQILVDAARSRNAAKRGYKETLVDSTLIKDGLRGTELAPVSIIDVNLALDELALLDVRQARVVELRYFAGLENTEIGTLLGISESTVIREWHMARAWLFQRLRTPVQS